MRKDSIKVLSYFNKKYLLLLNFHQIFFVYQIQGVSFVRNGSQLNFNLFLGKLILKRKVQLILFYVAVVFL